MLSPNFSFVRRRSVAAWVQLDALIGGVLCLAVAASPALAAPDQGLGNVTLDAASCAALGAAAARGNGQFAAARAACGMTEEPRRGVAPASVHARQLQLYSPAAAADAFDGPGAADVPVTPPNALPANAPKTRGGKKAPTSHKPAANPANTGNRKLPVPLVRAIQLAPEIDRVAAHNAIDPLLLHAIARVESMHNPQAVSHAGALGLMQVMPATGARFGVQTPAALHDVPTNLDVSARYLRVLKRRFPGDLQLVLAAYNAGEGAVEKHGRRIPPYRETQAYVRKVLNEYALLREGASRAP